MAKRKVNCSRRLSMICNKKRCKVYLFGEEDILDTGRKIVKQKGIMPVYKTAGAAAADCAIPEEVTVQPHKTMLIDLYIGFEIPKGYCIKMYPRSSLLVKRGLMQPVTIIDQDFSGNKVHALVYNITDEPVVLEKGERICQIMLEPTYDVIDWVHEKNERDKKGFGGTGRI